MNSEKRYQSICEMLHSYDMATGNRGADHVIKNPFEWVNNPYQPFYATAADLLIDTLSGIDSKITSASTLAAIKRFYKSTNRNAARMHGIVENIDENGVKRFVIIDGYRLIRLNADPVSIPHVDKEKAFDSDSINKIMQVNRYGEKLNLPTVQELKAFISEMKAKHGTKNNIPYCIDGFIYVNPQFLLDFMQALPGCEAIRPEDAKHPIYFKSEDGDGILLPVNPATVKDNAA